MGAKKSKVNNVVFPVDINENEESLINPYQISMYQTFSISLLFKKILEYLPKKDLQENVTLVSKIFYQTAADMLYKRKKIVLSSGNGSDSIPRYLEIVKICPREKEEIICWKIHIPSEDDEVTHAKNIEAIQQLKVKVISVEVHIGCTNHTIFGDNDGLSQESPRFANDMRSKIRVCSHLSYDIPGDIVLASIDTLRINFGDFHPLNPINQKNQLTEIFKRLVSVCPNIKEVSYNGSIVEDLYPSLESFIHATDDFYKKIETLSLCEYDKSLKIFMDKHFPLLTKASIVVISPESEKHFNTFLEGYKNQLISLVITTVASPYQTQEYEIKLPMSMPNLTNLRVWAPGCYFNRGNERERGIPIFTFKDGDELPVYPKLRSLRFDGEEDGLLEYILLMIPKEKLQLDKMIAAFSNVQLVTCTRHYALEETDEPEGLKWLIGRICPNATFQWGTWGVAVWE